MSAGSGLAIALENSLKYLRTTLTSFGEDDSGFAPRPEMFTVAAHVAHVADTVDWFVEGAFGAGWDMDFEGHNRRAREVGSLDAAIGALERAYASAIDTVRAASDEELFTPISDERIMGGAPRSAIVSGITDHSAHHRGALSVYARLLGREPAMPYA